MPRWYCDTSTVSSKDFKRNYGYVLVLYALRSRPERQDGPQSRSRLGTRAAPAMLITPLSVGDFSASLGLR